MVLEPLLLVLDLDHVHMLYACGNIYDLLPFMVVFLCYRLVLCWLDEIDRTRGSWWLCFLIIKIVEVVTQHT